MNTGEVLRRTVFNLLDASKGGKLQKLKEVNKREIVEGVTEDPARLCKEKFFLLPQTSGMERTQRFSGHDER